MSQRYASRLRALCDIRYAKRTAQIRAYQVAFPISVRSPNARLINSDHPSIASGLFILMEYRYWISSKVIGHITTLENRKSAFSLNYRGGIGRRLRSAY